MILLLFVMLLSVKGFSTIYGTDSLLEVVDTPDPRVAILKNSVAVQIQNTTISNLLMNSFRTLENSMICSDERFIRQPLVGSCTGFLISDRHLLTALHCFANTDCKKHKWVFDVYLNSEQDTSISLSEENIYTCSQIVAQSYNNRLDYAVVELSRPVAGRQPLEIDYNPVSAPTPIFSIHSPRGLPLKYSTGTVRDSSGLNFFTSAIDVMRGSSGAPIINAHSYKVIGILAQGDHDYEMQDEPFCNRYKRCAENECRGEDSTRVSEIPNLQDFTRPAP